MCWEKGWGEEGAELMVDEAALRKLFSRIFLTFFFLIAFWWTFCCSKISYFKSHFPYILLSELWTIHSYWYICLYKMQLLYKRYCKCWHCDTERVLNLYSFKGPWLQHKLTWNFLRMPKSCLCMVLTFIKQR